jgi:UDPglucose 6-dehydrogenase
MADFCEKTGADISEVAKGMGLDKRIGDRFLNPGPGYGGSCFPKDTHAMAHMGYANGVKMALVETAIEGNIARKKEMAKRILNSIRHIENPKIAVLGLAFKGGTDDCRESPSMEILTEILSENDTLNIYAYDPQAMPNAKMMLGDKISYAKDVRDAAQDADVLVILTEWEEFRDYDLSELKKLMKGDKILDFRNIFDANKAKKLGFNYIGIGK